MASKFFSLSLVCGIVFSSFTLLATEEEVFPIAETLLTREPGWRPQITLYHPEGTPDTVIFFEENALVEEVPVKQLKLYANGALKSEMDLIQIEEKDPGFKEWKNTVVPHGVSASFFSDGKCEKILHYDRGVLHGKVQVFYEDGVLKAEGTFNQGIQVGKILSFFDKGEKQEEGEYKKGKLEGDFCRYFQNGKKQSIVPHKDGVPHGNAIEWFESGSMKASLRYTNGVLHSEGKNSAVLIYNEEKSIIEVQDFQNGEPIGTHLR